MDRAPVAMQAPAWFAQVLDITPPTQRFGQAFADGRTGVLTVTADPGILVDRVWKTVVVQARISALNIFTILFLLTLILRANARMLRRLTEATDRFRQGHLDTRMDIKGTLESRAVANTFNDMAGKVQSLVHSLRETQQLQSEQLHFTRQLIDALPLPVFVREADGTFVDANRAWQRLFQNGDPGLPGQGMFPGLTAPHLLSPAQSRQLAMSQDNEVLVQPPANWHAPWPTMKRPSPARTARWPAPWARWLTSPSANAPSRHCATRRTAPKSRWPPSAMA